ncbi:testicular acid phosphatase homolog isoform X1 [Harmonia axyridis]|uniref:testicular acid phosphatase homolog isoform X1 n=1 Tax=Harmonia axyridis TaxID=115357 RepID=UPI001E278A7B|nr:testicular acid phosphatase homolog isoform X1 [Harmonia axyridis]
MDAKRYNVKFSQSNQCCMLEFIDNCVIMLVVFKFLALLSTLYLCKAEDELIAVTAILRHGARIPVSFYASDPYKNITWPFALGDLTNKGIKEMHHVGKWLRKRYSSFLSEIHTPSEIYAHSVDFDRCYMTAEATLAGLYPARGKEVWNSNIRWQPVPIHGSPNSQDIETNMLNPCPNKLAAVANLIYNLPEYPAIAELYNPILKIINERAGENVTLPQLYSFYDTVFSEKALDLPLPEWVAEIYPKILPLIKLYTELNSINPQEVKIQIGPLMTQILNQFERAITGEGFGTTKTIYRKFMAYFSTEWMLYDFAYGLGLESIDIPQYGALFLVELRRNWEGHYVKILFRKSSKPGTKAVPWKFKDYGHNPSFSKFRKYLEPLRTNTTQWVSMCHNFTGALPKTVTGVPIS